MTRVPSLFLAVTANLRVINFKLCLQAVMPTHNSIYMVPHRNSCYRQVTFMAIWGKLTLAI